MNRNSLFILLWLTCFCINSVLTVKPRKIFTDGIKIVNVLKQIDLTTPVVKITSKVIYENIGTKTQSNIYFIVSKNDLPHIAVFSYKEANNQKRNIKLSLFKQFTTNKDPKYFEEYRMYEVALNKPLSPNSQVEINFVLELTHKQVAYPLEITFEQTPSYYYNDLYNFLAPYKVENQKSIVNTNGHVMSIRPQETLELDSKYEYDIKQELDAFEEKEFEIYYSVNELYTTSDIHRKVYISEYQEAEFIESHVIRNKANNLIGTFSRIKYEKVKEQLNYVVKALNFQIPKDSYGYYYRDSVGNISSSTIGDMRNKKFMVIQPRFPLMGGWNTEFTIKYKRPIYKILKLESNQIDQDRHFKINLVGNFYDLMSIDNFVLEIILPEFAQFVIKKLPSDIDLNITEYKTYEYMDIYGRPTLRIEGKNILPSQDTILEFSYEYNSLYLMWKPYYASLLFFIFFITILFVNRSRIFLSKNSEALLKVNEFVQIIAKFDSECKKKNGFLESFLFTIDSFKTGNLNFEQFENSINDILIAIKTQNQIIDQVAEYIIDILPESKIDVILFITFIYILD